MDLMVRRGIFFCMKKGGDLPPLFENRCLTNDAQTFDIDFVVANEFRVHLAFDTHDGVGRDFLVRLAWAQSNG